MSLLRRFPEPCQDWFQAELESPIPLQDREKVARHLQILALRCSQAVLCLNDDEERESIGSEASYWPTFEQSVLPVQAVVASS